MNKPISYLIECLIYIVLLCICLPYAIISYKNHLYDVMYMNIAGVIIMATMIFVNLCCYVKSLINRNKKRGDR